MNDYHITRPDGKQEGPFSEEELKELYRNRKLPQGSLVWTPGWDTWKICQDTFSWYAVPPPLPISIAPPVPADYIAVITGRTEDAEDDLRALAEKYRKTKSFGG